MEVDKFSCKETFYGEESERLEVYYDNRGEPYRQGISLSLDIGEDYTSVFLTSCEARRLKDMLNKLYPTK